MRFNDRNICRTGTVGIREAEGKYIEVISGLSGSDRFVKWADRKLADGQAVLIID